MNIMRIRYNDLCEPGLIGPVTIADTSILNDVFVPKLIKNVNRGIVEYKKTQISRFKEWWFQDRVWNDSEAHQLSTDLRIEEPVPEEFYFDHVDNIAPQSNYPMIARRFAEKARMVLPLSTHTVANELVVKDWIYKEMLLHGMRETHIVNTLPIAVALSFMKTNLEITVDKYTALEATALRRRKGGAKWYSRGTPWIGEWFGHRYDRATPRSE